MNKTTENKKAVRHLIAHRVRAHIAVDELRAQTLVIDLTDAGDEF